MGDDCAQALRFAARRADVPIPELPKVAHGRNCREPFAEALHTAAFVIHRDQRRRIAQALTAAGLPCWVPGATLAQAPVLTALVAWLTLLRDGGDSTALLHALDAHLYGRRDQAGQGVRTTLTTGGPWTMERLHRECPPGLSEGQQRALSNATESGRGNALTVRSTRTGHPAARSRSAA